MNQETLKQVRRIYRNEKRKGKTSWEAMKIALESVPDTYGMDPYRAKSHFLNLSG